jgi:hypothetical protein
MSIVPSAEASETRLPDSCEKCRIDDGISSRKVNEPQAPATAEPCLPAEYLRTSFRLAAVLETLRLSSSVWWQRGLHPRWLPRPPGLHAIGAHCCTRYACRARGPAVDTAKVAECPMRSPGGIAAGLGASPERRVPDADGAPCEPAVRRPVVIARDAKSVAVSRARAAGAWSGLPVA